MIVYRNNNGRYLQLITRLTPTGPYGDFFVTDDISQAYTGLLPQELSQTLEWTAVAVEVVSPLTLAKVVPSLCTYLVTHIHDGLVINHVINAYDLTDLTSIIDDTIRATGYEVQELDTVTRGLVSPT